MIFKIKKIKEKKERQNEIICVLFALCWWFYRGVCAIETEWWFIWMCAIFEITLSDPTSKSHRERVFVRKRDKPFASRRIPSKRYIFHITFNLNHVLNLNWTFKCALEILLPQQQQQQQRFCIHISLSDFSLMLSK